MTANPGVPCARFARSRHAALFAALAFVVGVAGCSLPGSTDRPDRGATPNVVIILTDDQGYADVGVFGATGFDTPNLDQLAADGMMLTDFYVASSGCSPSRAALLTGAYPLGVGLPHVLFPFAQVGLHPDEVTMAEMLSEKGYATAAVGKWHLGDHPRFLPTSHGFDSYFGLPYSNDMSPDPKNNPRESAARHPPLPLLRDTTVVEREPDQSTLVGRYTEEAVRFIERNASAPFFLYLAHSMPHVPIYASPDFSNRSATPYGDVIEEIDWSVGEVLDALERSGVSDNTFVVFTSDNGPWLIFGDHAGSAAPLREGKDTAFEGGQRVPAIVRFPGRVPAGSVSSEMVLSMDILPTVAQLTASTALDTRMIDGRDVWPILSGVAGARSPHEAFFYYRGRDLQAVRSGRWKLHVPHWYQSIDGGVVANGGAVGSFMRRDIGLALFDLEADVGETTDLAGTHPGVVDSLLEYVEWARDDIGDALTDRTGRNARQPGRVEPWNPSIDN